MRESKFQRALIKQLEDVGARVFNVHGHGFQESGWPDLQVYHPIWTGHLELKVSAKVEAHQQFILNDLRRLGTPAFALRLRGDDLIIEDFGVFEGFCSWDGRTQAKSLLLGLREASEGIIAAKEASARRAVEGAFLQGTDAYSMVRGVSGE